jgi:predicted Zn-dependent protease
MKKLQILFLTAALSFVGISQSGCSMDKSIVSGNNRSYAYTWAQEVQLGKESDQAAIAEYGLYANPTLAAYVNQIGQEVLLKSHARRPETPEEIRNTPFYFKVLDSPIVNAFALPGGYIYVTRGLLAHLDNEAQLAMVLGHEIGHVTARHASIAAGRQQRAQIGVMGATILGAVLGASPDLLQTGQQMLSQGAGLFLLKNSREAESEADDLGVEYTALSGYKAEEAARFFESLKRIQDQSGQQIPTFMSTHPDPGQREQVIMQRSQEWAAKTPMTKVNQAQLYAKIDGITIGDNPRQGFVENNIFYHPDMKFQFPTAGWQVSNGAAQVQMLDTKQQAMMSFSLAEGTSAATAARTFSTQQGLQVTNTGNVQINGFPCTVVEAQATTQDQGTIAVRAYFIEYGGNVLHFLGYTSAANYPTYKAQFDQIVGGFQSLKEADKLNRQPYKLAIQKASRLAPFQNFVTMRLTNGLTPESLAIINQVALTAPISIGKSLKLVK